MTVRFLVDECCRRALTVTLRSKGHDVVSVSETAPSVSDMDVLALARRDSRILITDDRDFGELSLRRNEGVAGVILLRTRSDDGVRQAELIEIFLTVAADRVEGFFTVIEDSRYRQRPLA